jgi:hypothetical protein
MPQPSPARRRAEVGRVDGDDRFQAGAAVVDQVQGFVIVKVR